MRLFDLLITIFLLCVPISLRAQPLIPPNTSGLMLAKVVSVARVDERPVDGDLIENVKVEIEKSTGCTSNMFGIVVEFGGLRRPNGIPVPVWDGPPPGTFKEGERYWIVISSRPEYGLCNPKIIGWWKSDDQTVASEFHKAVQDDILHKRPHYFQTEQFFPAIAPGITINHYIETPDKIFVETLKDDKLLWKKQLKGTPSNYIPLTISQANQIGEGFEADGPSLAGIDEKSNVITISTTENLDAENPYAVAAGKYDIRRTYDLASGSLIADFIHDKYMGIYSVVSSKRVYTENIQWNRNLPTPKSVANSDQKGNLEKIARKFDSQTGNLLSENRFYYDSAAANKSTRQSVWVHQKFDSSK